MLAQRYKLFFIFPIFLVSCLSADRDAQRHQLENAATTIQTSFVPDKRLEVFDVQMKLENGAWLISGETTLPEAKATLAKALDSLLAGKKYQLDMALLPSPALGDSTHGIVRVSVANLRKQPRHTAEMVDQLVMGTPIRVLKKDENWYLIQTPYRYLAWLDSGAFVRWSEHDMETWKSSVLQRFEENYGTIRMLPNSAAMPVADIVMGSVVKKSAGDGKWTRILLPDGREGFVPAASLRDYSYAFNESKPKRKDIVSLSHRFTGVPYLWGGNSSKGFDCSGFTQTVFRMNGWLLPRDANQQVKEGIKIEPDEKFSNVLPGDLLFFGGDDRITHVGISLGGAQFIHANGISGDVHVNSLDSRDANYSAYRRSVFKQVRRILN